jgi:hypothetical protein
MIIGTLVEKRREVEAGLRGSREESEVVDMNEQGRHVRLSPDESFRGVDGVRRPGLGPPPGSD